jgi:hypothetical protein
MKHALALIAAVILLAFASVVVWFSRTALTVPVLGFSGGCIALAFALAIPADFKTACTSVAPYIPVVRGSGPPPGGGT